MGKLRNKLVVSFLFVAAFSVLSIGGYALLTITRVISNMSIERQESRVSLISGRVEDFLENALFDLSFIRETAAVKRVRDALVSGNMVEIDAGRKNLELDFLNFANQKRIYHKIRFLEKSGMELVRVDRPDQESGIVPPGDLQNISRMYYFRDSISLEDGGIMISALELSREGGRVVRPLLPTIRYATPVYDTNKAFVVGSVILNLRAGDFLKGIRKSLSDKDMLFLIDKEGYYLFNAVRQKEWGSNIDLDTGENFINDFDEDTFGRITSNTSLMTFRDKGNIISTIPVYLDKAKTLPLGYLMDIVPREVVFAPAISFRNVFIFAAAAVILISLILSVVLAASITNPLVYLTKGAEKMSKGDIDMEITVKSKDEIRVLAESIERLRKSVKFLIDRAKKG